jgi:hypothetical protein
MPHRKQPPQQDAEEEDDDLVTGKQFKEMMHIQRDDAHDGVIDRVHERDVQQDYYVHE